MSVFPITIIVVQRSRSYQPLSLIVAKLADYLTNFRVVVSNDTISCFLQSQDFIQINHLSIPVSVFNEPIKYLYIKYVICISLDTKTHFKLEGNQLDRSFLIQSSMHRIFQSKSHEWTLCQSLTIFGYNHRHYRDSKLMKASSSINVLSNHSPGMEKRMHLL